MREFFGKHILKIIMAISILPGLIFWNSPTYVDLDKSFFSPLQSFEHPLGCDKLGRDIYSLYSFGMFVTILISIPGRIFTLFLSIMISLISTYLPFYLKIWIDTLSSVFLSIPSILIALIAIFTFGTGFTVFLISIALSDWAQSYESLQGKIREVEESGYVLVSKKFGANRFYIFKEHIIPELKNITYNLFITGIPAVVMTISIFSYLGIDFGSDIFGPGLGEQISFSRDYAHKSLMPMVVPILGVIMLVISIQPLGDSKKEVKT